MKKYSILALMAAAIFVLPACGATASPEHSAPAEAVETTADANITSDEEALVAAAEGNKISEEYVVMNGELYKSGTPVNMEITELDLRNHRLGDYSFLADFTDLKILLLDNSDIYDLSPLSGLDCLETLNLVGCSNLTSLEALSGCVALNSLTVEVPSVYGLEFLSGLLSLKSLSIGTLHADADLAILSRLSMLTTLSLSFDTAPDLTALAELSQLEILSLNINENADLSPLATLTNLRYLSISSDQQPVLDISCLKELTALTRLTLWINVSDYSPLSYLTELEFLSLYSSNVLDASFLSNMVRLNTALLYVDRMENLQVLADSDISTLKILCCPATDEEKVMLQKAFPACDISNCQY